MKLFNALKELELKIEIPVEGVSPKDLNNIEPYDFKNYDRSFSFRKEVIEKGYSIITLIACYYQGWECDEWACVAIKDGKKFKIETTHGSFRAAELERL